MNERNTEKPNDKNEKKKLSPSAIISVIVGILTLIFGSGIYWRLFPSDNEDSDLSQSETTTSYQSQAKETLESDSLESDPLTTSLTAENGENSQRTVGIALDPNGGTLETNTVTVYIGEPYGILPIPTRYGYTFDGWYLFDKKITSDTIVTEYNGTPTFIANWIAGSFEVTFDANGGTLSSKNTTVTFGSTYNELPTPSRLGYTFAGWFTSQNGGQQISSNDIVNIPSNHTLFAHWNANVFTLSFNANGGFLSTMFKEVNYGEAYGTLPTPQKDYYIFDGWYTDVSGGSKVTNSTMMGNSDVTVYAHWTEKPLSVWKLESDVPPGAQIVDQKWIYTKTETNESYESSMNGWTQTGSHWEETENETYYYADFPTGFSTSDPLYNKYNKYALDSVTGWDTKREVSSSTHYTYIYWHWNYPLQDDSLPNDRLVSDEYTPKYSKFVAFESFTNHGHTDSKGTTVSNMYFCNQGNYIDVSWWWYRFSVYKQTYTDYTKVYEYVKVTENLESYSQVTAKGEISNVRKYVRYREK